MLKKFLFTLCFSSTFLSIPVLAEEKPNITQLEAKAEKNDTKAMIELAKYYFVNGRTDAERDKAAIYIVRAAELGDPEAITIKTNLQKSLTSADKESIQQLQSYADKDDPTALTTLGILYLSGLSDLPQDTEKGKQLLEKAIQLGSLSATTKLGIFYFSGSYGITPDLVKGMTLIEQAAEKDDVLAKNFLADGGAWTQMGLAYIEGLNGVKADKEKGLSYLQKAVNTGADQAQLVLGMVYFVGRGGVKVDHAEGKKWIKKAAAQGNKQAQEWLSMLEKIKQ